MNLREMIQEAGRCVVLPSKPPVVVRAVTLPSPVIPFGPCLDGPPYAAECYVSITSGGM